MSRYYTPSLFIFCILGGVVIYFIASELVSEQIVALISGAIASIIISITVPLMFYYADRKYNLLKKEIGDKIVLDERVGYVVGQEIKRGFMVTTKNSLFVISSDNNKPVKFEIKRSDIKKISISDDVFLNIFLDYDKCIRIFSSDCEKLLEKLAKEGFAN